MRLLLVFSLFAALLGCQPKMPAPPLESIAQQNIWKMRTLEAQCTAFQIDKELIVTAAHCVQPPLFLFRNGDDVMEGTLVGLSKEADVALFFVPGAIRPGFPVAQGIPSPGEAATAIGFPARVTDNYVFVPVRIAAVTRDSDGSIFAHVMGPSIWPGMSGGPLINSQGEVIGLVSSTGQLFFGPEDDPTRLVREEGNFSADLYKTISDIISAANKNAFEAGLFEEVPDDGPETAE